jgi:hypothetical protein
MRKKVRPLPQRYTGNSKVRLRRYWEKRMIRRMELRTEAKGRCGW